LVVREPFVIARAKRFACGVGRLHDVQWMGPVAPEFWEGLRRLVIDLVDERERRR